MIASGVVLMILGVWLLLQTLVGGLPGRVRLVGHDLMAATRARSGGRRQPDDDPFVAPNKGQEKRFKQKARGQEDVLARTYEAGRKEGAATRAKKSPQRRSGASRSRRSTPGARSARTAARQLQAPVRDQVTSGLRLIGLSLAVTALYAVLNNAAAFGGVLGGLGRAFDWLGSTRGVPAKT